MLRVDRPTDILHFLPFLEGARPARVQTRFFGDCQGCGS